MHAELSPHSLSVKGVAVAGRLHTLRPNWRWQELCGTLILKRPLAITESWEGEDQEGISYAADKMNSSFKMLLLQSMMDLTWCLNYMENSGKI